MSNNFVSLKFTYIHSLIIHEAQAYLFLERLADILNRLYQECRELEIDEQYLLVSSLW
jgi:hypothetical protein